MKKIILFLTLVTAYTHAQNYWQQHVDYHMDIQMDVKKFQYDGKMDLVYTNNSPDTLRTVYFHLYYNAFQPGSLMDERLKHIADPDGRMTNNLGTKEAPKYESRIAKLTSEEIGYQEIKTFYQNGFDCDYKIMGTIIEVTLSEPLPPNTSTNFYVEWQAQVPQIIRRGGRNNKEGIDFSMTQWYPKMAEYDREGWHLDEYIGREFYAPFGDFDVSITLPSSYVIGASGQVQNEDMMPGYNDDTNVRRKPFTTWNFKAKNIHDFAWAADENFKVDKQQVENGPTVYYVYDKDLPEEYAANWHRVQPYVADFYKFMNGRFGKFPWSTYSIIQGGDGGMEYGTSTLITGKRNFNSLMGVIYHEAAHSWFQQLYAFDETRDEWMDEGFTSYAEAAALHAVMGENKDAINPYQSAYDGYYYLTETGKEEPLSILADYYDHNLAYGLGAYYKGQVYLAQLGYVIGEDALAETMLKFYDTWHLKHPKYQDLQKIAQEVSGINLKWYNNLFINTIRTVDYVVKRVEDKKITLENKSNFPMPLDVLVTFKDGTKTLYYIPINAMRGTKNKENQFYQNIEINTLDAWGWTFPEYSFTTEKPVEKVEIDYTQRLADVDRYNNVYPSNKDIPTKNSKK